MYLIGYDIGSSSIKAALVETESQNVVAVVQYPSTEMDIASPQPGWAEQAPEVWWENVCLATKKLIHESGIDGKQVSAIGLSYQMHGLVLIDKQQTVLRPSIIWCDSRAVEYGNQAFEEIGSEKCLEHLLNSPGNFTASKLKWVLDNEPDIYQKVFKFLLPGDFIAMKLTGEVNTTVSGLSEGMLWDFKDHEVAGFLLDYYEIDEQLVPDIIPTFSQQGNLQSSAAELLGLQAGIPLTYRAGDQPNNALSLGVVQPGQIAATGGTSGVVYGIVDQPLYDPQSRVNGFAHVNHSEKDPRIGMLLCINGAGIQYSWLKQQVAGDGATYREMDQMISTVPVGSDGLRIIPFGNGAERVLDNMNLGSHIMNLHFNRHSKAHIYRAALEGIAFSFIYGMEILTGLGMEANLIRVGNDNLFRSPVFATTITALLQCEIEVVRTTGAVGAARAAGIGAGFYKDLDYAFKGMETLHTYQPPDDDGVCKATYDLWKADLNKLIA